MRRWPIGGLLVMGIMVAGCGGGSGGSTSASPTAQVQARSRAFAQALTAGDRTAFPDFLSDQFADEKQRTKADAIKEFGDLLDGGTHANRIDFQGEAFSVTPTGQVVQAGTLVITGTDPRAPGSDTLGVPGTLTWANEGGVWRVVTVSSSGYTLNGTFHAPVMVQSHGKHSG